MAPLNKEAKPGRPKNAHEEPTMGDLLEVFRNTRLMVLAAMTAALYTIVLVLFKPFAIVPGLTELRLAPFVPCLFSFLFGPAAAWGAAIGNLVGDILGGTLTPGSIFGFVANLLFGYVPYKLWQGLFRERPVESAGAAIVPKAVVCSVGASAVCAAIVGYGVEALGLFKGDFLTLTVMLNNSAVGGIVAAILLPLLVGRARRLRLTYPQLLRAQQFSPPVRDTVLSAIVLAAGGCGVGLAAVSFAKVAPIPIEAIGLMRKMPVEAVMRSNLREQTATTLRTLTPREEKILKMRFGVGGGAEHTLEEVGKTFTVTRERIRQIESKALRKLRHPSRSKDLRVFTDRP